ncbi:maleylacetoacetate isomerase [Aestuariicella hydrocarbonica]|uniref:Maleylacetoacetate isomerase n=1 Tax=Pseudomaricurvus hydrocarbonicus TaxID=1470433 RepID=A0A9E5JYD8_9GAMM|nr:maleylacetoacetate isomerase [Aestuariicella hydrocarbonica]
MQLYSYFRSSAAYRIRIALNLKQLDYQSQAINLLGGEHKSPEYLAINPQGLVPSLKTDSGLVLTQTPAILEWLEENYPQPALLPSDTGGRARVRSWCYQIACDIHPICNLRVINYVSNELGGGEAGKLAWLHHWITEGFKTLEQQLASKPRGPYCYGEQVTLADVFLIPQVFNALRFNLDMSVFPVIMEIYDSCNRLNAFMEAVPERQADSA